MSITALTQVPNCDGIWSATNAATLGGTNGNQITQLNDGSGAANHATAAANAGPELPAAYAQPVVVFNNASAETLTLPAGVSTNPQAFAFFAVLDFSTLAPFGGNTFITIFEAGTSGAAGLLVDLTDGKAHLAWFSNSTMTTMTARIPSGRSVVGVVGSGSALKLYVNGTVESFAAAGGSTVTGGRLGKWTTVAAAYYPGNMDVAAHYSATPTAQQALDVVSFLAGDKNVSLATPRGRVVFDGDSRTRGSGDGANRNVVRQIGLPNTIDQYCYAVPGQLIADMNVDAATQVVPLLGVVNPTAVVVCDAGSNEIQGAVSAATVYGRLSTYGSTCKTAGAQAVVVTTITPRTDATGGLETARQAFNGLLRADFTIPTANPYVFLAGAGVTYATHMVDLAALPAYAATNAAGNTSNYSDGIHATAIGDGAKAALLRYTLNLVLGLDQVTAADVTAQLTSYGVSTLTPTTAAAAVLDASASAHNTAGTIGAKINAPAATGGSGNGTGDTAVNHNFGGTDSLRYTTSGNVGISGASVIAYLASDFNASTFTVRARTFTKDDGRWVDPLMLDAGLDYVILFEKPGVFGPDTATITV